MGKRTEAGKYYVAHDGQLDEAAPFVPDVVMCRRVADFPGGRAPARAAVSACSQCAAPIAWDPSGPHQDCPKICLQCGDVAPLPFPH